MTPSEFQTRMQTLMQEHSAAMQAIQKTFQESMQKENVDFQTKMVALQAEMNKPSPVPPCPAPPIPPVPPCPTPAPKTTGKRPKKQTKI